MNTHAEYRRHSDTAPDQSTTSPAVEAAVSELARHRDPSLQSGQGQEAPKQTQARVAWVRPTEIGSYVGPMVGRGIDLQAELVRRARRTPTTAARTFRHAASAVATARTTGQEGLGL